MSQTLLASLISSAGPQSGQKNRSSGNFSTENAPLGTKSLLWKVIPQDNNISPETIKFNVMKDSAFDIDPTIWSGLSNDSTTAYSSDRSYYISNPSGSGASGFTVLVYAVKSRILKGVNMVTTLGKPSSLIHEIQMEKVGDWTLFKFSESLQNRMENFLEKKKADQLTPDEVAELDTIGELDRIFTHINAMFAAQNANQ